MPKAKNSRFSWSVNDQSFIRFLIYLFLSLPFFRLIEEKTFSFQPTLCGRSSSFVWYLEKSFWWVFDQMFFSTKIDYTHNVAGSTNDTRGWFLLFNIKLFLQRTDKQRLRTTDLFIGFWNYFSSMIYQGFPSRSFHLSFQRKQINESFPKFRTSASLRTHLKLSTHPF